MKRHTMASAIHQLRTICVALACCVPAFLNAADVSYFGVVKTILYEQTNQPSPQMLSASPCMFTAFVIASTNNTVTNATVKPSNATSMRQLLVDTNGASWRFEERFPTQAAMDSVYPSGSAFSPVNYTFSMYGANDGLRAASINFFLIIIPVSYPPTPEITNLASTKTIDHTRDFTLGWKSLGGSQLSIVQLSILDLSSNVVFTTPLPFQPGALDGTSTSAMIPANTLPPGQELVAHLTAGNPGLPNTNSYPGALGVAALTKDTEFRLVTRLAPAAPLIQIMDLSPNVNLTISGDLDRLYHLQASSDLLTWTNTYTFYATLMPTNVSDIIRNPQQPRFYRVKVGD